MLDEAFEALKTFDWGTDRNALKPIDEAVVATRGDTAARKELETRLAAVLATPVSRDAKDFVCRTLMIVGTAECVPALAALLPDKELSHMARYALERIPAPEAAAAMREALGKVDGLLGIGLMASLGVRRDEASVPALTQQLSSGDAAVSAAAATALGDIAGSAAVKALQAAKPTAPECRRTVADALLVCAERALAAGKKIGRAHV